MFLSLAEFFGHFHPVVVHLPIGILLMAVLFHWLSFKAKYASFRPVVPFMVMCGMITAIIACISGFLLSLSDDYNHVIVSWHMWMGIAVAVLSILWHLQYRDVAFLRGVKYLSGGLFILVMITGHLGGVLTHGSDYLTAPLANIFSDEAATNSVFTPVANVQEANVYEELVQPLLQTKCYSCHGPNKQKGGLRMDDSTALMTGGKNGAVIERHNAEESEMIRRLLLPVDNDDHMPPKEKSQLSEDQIALLHWWIDNGAAFAKKVKDIEQDDKIKSTLLTFQEVPQVQTTVSYVPDVSVKKADDRIFAKLNERGIMIMPVGSESNYLSANFFTDSLVTDEDMQLLLSLKDQLIWLRIGFTDLHDAQMTNIGKLTNLTRLSMEHTPVTDAGIEQLRSCKQLQYLNIVGTGVTAKGLLTLKDLKHLRSIYVYQSKIVKEEWPALERSFPEARIDSGGYIVPTLESDTTEVKFVSP